jgi:hypothetical protein
MQYGMHYRKMAGGKGYVFQSRFKSTLIENDSYLVQSILYLLRNPVRAGIVQVPEDYIWSSARYYFSDEKAKIVDQVFVNGLFNSKKEFLSALHSPSEKELPIVITKYGELMGGDGFLASALKKFERRNRPTSQSRGVHRKDEQCFDPVEKVIWEFERGKGLSIDEIDTRTLEGKRLRAELLVRLKEIAGLKYREIAEFDIFSDLGLSGLRAMYRNFKNPRK